MSTGAEFNIITIFINLFKTFSDTLKDKDRRRIGADWININFEEL